MSSRPGTAATAENAEFTRKNLVSSSSSSSTSHKAPVTALAWSASGRKLASASTDGYVKVWSVSPDTVYSVSMAGGVTKCAEVASLLPEPAALNGTECQWPACVAVNGVLQHNGGSLCSSAAAPWHAGCTTCAGGKLAEQPQCWLVEMQVLKPKNM